MTEESTTPSNRDNEPGPNTELTSEQTVNQSVDAFSNKQIEQNLIKTSDLQLVPLSAKYRKINISLAVVIGLCLMLILFLATGGLFFEFPDDPKPAVWTAYGLIIFLSTWSAVYHYCADPLLGYALREHDLNYQSGLIFRSLASQPILRIQHIEIKRGPIERRAGLATLQVFSAGGVSYTFNIPGLEYPQAVKLRQFILDHRDLAADV